MPGDQDQGKDTRQKRNKKTSPPQEERLSLLDLMHQQEDEVADEEWDDGQEFEGEDGEEPALRKTRKDAGIPRMRPRDITAFRWIGEQRAASSENLQELLGRMAEGETNEEGKLSASRIRHIIEDRWEPAGMVYSDTILGKKWVWLTKRAMQRAGLPFSPHRPADINVNHLHHINRIRLHLEDLYSQLELPGRWESELQYERSKKEWKARKKADPITYIPHEYRLWHTPDGVWTFRNEGDTKDRLAFIEVEVSPKSPDRTLDILEDLASHGTTWYFVEMDPKKGVYSVLMEALDKLDDRFKGKFYFYDLQHPEQLLYHFEQPKKTE